MRPSPETHPTDDPQAAARQRALREADAELDRLRAARGRRGRTDRDESALEILLDQLIAPLAHGGFTRLLLFALVAYGVVMMIWQGIAG